jgi:hypothetical protein
LSTELCDAETPSGIVKFLYEYVERKSAQVLNVQMILEIQLIKTVRSGELFAKLAENGMWRGIGTIRLGDSQLRYCIQ